MTCRSVTRHNSYSRRSVANFFSIILRVLQSFMLLRRVMSLRRTKSGRCWSRFRISDVGLGSLVAVDKHWGGGRSWVRFENVIDFASLTDNIGFFAQTAFQSVSRTFARKSPIGGDWRPEFGQKLLIYSVSYFNFGAWCLFGGGVAYQSPPVVTGLPVSQELLGGRLPLCGVRWCCQDNRKRRRQRSAQLFGSPRLLSSMTSHERTFSTKLRMLAKYRERWHRLLAHCMINYLQECRSSLVFL